MGISETNNIKQLKLGCLDKISEIRTMPPPSLLLVSLLLLVLPHPGVLGFHLPGTSSTSCTAPGHAPGTCVQITDCPSIEQFLENQITKEKVKFFSKFSCGFTNNIPNICCPLDNNIVAGRTAATTTTTPATTTTTTTTTTATTTTFRIVEETTKPSRFRPRNNDNDLRLGFNEWRRNTKCSSEFCRGRV